jgi:hypothetical protein
VFFLLDPTRLQLQSTVVRGRRCAGHRPGLAVLPCAALLQRGAVPAGGAGEDRRPQVGALTGGAGDGVPPDRDGEAGRLAHLRAHGDPPAVRRRAGPVGIILNRPSLMSIKEAQSIFADDADITDTFSGRPLFFGGPLEACFFLLGPRVEQTGLSEEVMLGLHYGTDCITGRRRASGAPRSWPSAAWSASGTSASSMASAAGSASSCATRCAPGCGTSRPAAPPFWGSPASSRAASGRSCRGSSGRGGYGEPRAMAAL